VNATVGFVLTVYRDLALANRCLGSIRAAYPDSPITAISDGDPDPEWSSLAQKHDVKLIMGQRLWLIVSGVAYTQRILEEATSMPASHIIRLDTDTIVHRRLTFLPMGCVFGTRQWQGGIRSVQGGCTGICRTTLSSLLDLELLRQMSADYRLWCGGSKVLLNRCKSGVTSWDWSIGYLCKVKGVPVVGHCEIGSGWRRPPDGDFAISHPHKSLPETAGGKRGLRRLLPFVGK
jgi:hypothetical protein